MRSLLETIGASIRWVESERSVIAKKDNVSIVIGVDKKQAHLNGNDIELEVPAQIINDSTYIPLRFVSESFNLPVSWDGNTRTINIGKALSAKEVSREVSKAVLYIECYDKSNNLIATGSGVAITDTGKIATNYHVIEGAYRARAFFISGLSYDIGYVTNYDKTKDIAILEIPGVYFPKATLGDSDKIENGDVIYTIGSPKGLENTIDEGIISSKKRVFDGQPFIQFSASISSGSSGGALINQRGEVVGITTLSVRDAQNLNFAIPINEVKNYISQNLLYKLSDMFVDSNRLEFDNAVYEGDIVDGVPHGTGTMKFDDGTVYFGDFRNGQFHGIGTIDWPNRDHYEGDFRNNSREGFGIYVSSSNGIKYEGDFRDNKFHGKGKMTFSDGAYYIGDFKNDMFDGYGTYVSRDGSSYSGNFYRGEFVPQNNYQSTTSPVYTPSTGSNNSAGSKEAKCTKIREDYVVKLLEHDRSTNPFNGRSKDERAKIEAQRDADLAANGCI